VVTDAAYRPRNPEESLLYQVVAGELETFLASHQAQDRTIPKFVEDEFRSFLECGILAHGFVRVRCESCGHSPLVPFSSRRRGAEREPDSLAQVLYLRAYRAGEEPPEDAWIISGAHRLALARPRVASLACRTDAHGAHVRGVRFRRSWPYLRLSGRYMQDLGYEPYPGCPIPPAHYPLVNLGSLGWARQLRRC
jgi:hypothetical protein